jgi:hypothetical protein
VLFTCCEPPAGGACAPRPALPPAAGAERLPRAPGRRPPKGRAGEALRRPAARGRHHGRGLHQPPDRALPRPGRHCGGRSRPGGVKQRTADHPPMAASILETAEADESE